MYYLYLTLLAIFAFGSIVLLLVLLSAFIGFIRTDVPFIPSPRRDVSFLADRLQLSSRDVIYDLGSGNGRVLFMLERLTGAATVGYELMHWTHYYARLRAWLFGSKARFMRQDFFKHDISAATVVYCYLYPMLMPKVGEKIAAECRPGTRVIARDFAIPNLTQTDYIKTDGVHEIFIYTV